MKSVHDYVHAMKAQGLEVLTNAGTPTESGPARGALVVDTTNGKLYINTGTVASAVWNEVGNVLSSEITLTEGNLLIGNSSDVGTLLDIGNTNAGIAIGNGTTATIAALSGDVTMTNAGVTSVDVVDDSVIQRTQTSVTATADGLTTGLIPAGTRVVTVTSGSADNIITLPAIVAGQVITVITDSTGCEVRTPASSNEEINTVDSDGTNELALVGDAVFEFVAMDGLNWMARGWTNAGADIATLVPDAA